MKIKVSIKLVCASVVMLLSSAVYPEDRIPNLPKLKLSTGIICESPRECLGRSMIVMNLSVNNRTTKSATCLMEERRRGFVSFTCKNASISGSRQIKATERDRRGVFVRGMSIPANDLYKHYMIKLPTMGKYISVSTLKHQGKLYWNIHYSGDNRGRWKECSATAFFTADRGCVNSPEIIRPPQKRLSGNGAMLPGYSPVRP